MKKIVTRLLPLLAFALLFGANGGTAEAATAKISPSSQTRCAGATVSWTLTVGNTASNAFTFTFGDGSYDSGTSGAGSFPDTYSYSSTGLYGQVLSVSDGHGTQAQATSRVNINCF